MHSPRYHSGGIVGLAKNEVPVILTPGREEFGFNDPRLARKAVRQLMENTTGPGKLLQLTVHFDAREAIEKFRQASGSITALWAELALRCETQRMERRVRDLYDRFL